MNKAVIYARYSSDNQRDASIEDQIRVCREHAEKQGWQVVNTYCDHAVSGASLLRPGIQALLSDAPAGRFDIILSEAMDRLSRDQEDIAGIFKRMKFAGVRIMTLSEGEVSNLHVGLKGTMNALFLQDLADKTRRGLRGRVEKGKSGGGNSYGYDVVKKLDAQGNAVTGERKISRAEAKVVRRIFKEFAAGKAPRAIAIQLNKEDIPGPAGKAWGPSTIYGSTKRGNGILNNELYVGRLVWNRQRFIKDPDTGKRVSRLNPESEWIVQDVPEMRLIDQALWDRVKARQEAVTHTRRPVQEGNVLGSRKRPRHLLSGLVKCGVCGGGFSMISKDLLGCSTRRNKGTCDNGMNIRRDRLEAAVLKGLKDHLIRPESFKAFCKEFTEEINRGRMEQSATLFAQRGELESIDPKLKRLLDALYAGADATTIAAEMRRLEARQSELQTILENAKEPPPLLHPSMAEMYAGRIKSLYDTLHEDDAHDEAVSVIRDLIDSITLIVQDDRLIVELVGDLAGFLTFVSTNQKPATGGRGGSGIAGSQFPMVAGARNHGCSTRVLAA